VSLLNTTLWGSIFPGGIAGELADGSIDVAQVIDDLLYSLHVESRDDLEFWSESDLLEWIDECLKRLARMCMVFVGRDTTILTVDGQAAYTLPERYISTLHVSHVTNPLRPGNMAELEARDTDFRTTEGTPSHWYQDLLGISSFAVTPVPDTSDQALPLIYEGWPVAVTVGQTLVAAPPPLKGYLAMYVLSQAYGKESESEMPDLAKHCWARVLMYEEVFTSYYGPGM